MPTSLNSTRLAAHLAAAIFAVAASLPMQAAAADPPPAPLARVEPVVDTHFGEQVVDRYRWMENSADKDWLPFLKGQNAHTRAALDALPGRDALLARIRQLSDASAQTRKLQRTGSRLFF